MTDIRIILQSPEYKGVGGHRKLASLMGWSMRTLYYKKKGKVGLSETDKRLLERVMAERIAYDG